MSASAARAWWLSGALLAASLALGVVVLAHPAPFGFEAASNAWLGQSRDRVAWSLLTDLGSAPATGALALLVGVVLWLRGHKRGAVLVLAAMAAVVVVGAGMKYAFHRPRPVGAVLDALDPWSYPSGHATRAFAVASGMSVGASWCLRRSRAALVAVLAFAGAIGVALSRVALQEHALLDVTGAAILALAVAPLATALERWAAARGVLRRLDEPAPAISRP